MNDLGGTLVGQPYEHHPRHTMAFRQWASSPSLLAVLLIWLLVGTSVFQKRSGTLFTWDAFGYHLYLPAAVIHGDPLVKDVEWVDHERKEQNASGTLYQISTLENGKRVIRYPMGLAVAWAPWFMAGHWIAGALGFPQDGYSAPYDLAIRTGVWIYLLLGLLALRTVLRHRFSESTVALTLLLLFAATNLIDQATAGMAMPHITLFCVYAGILWATLRWVADRSTGRAVALAVLMGLAMLIRPSEAVCVLLPFLWHRKDETAQPFARAWKLRGQWILIGVVMFLIGLLQFAYWKAATGHWLVDSYNNPGEGLDLLTPHTWPFLFSFRKGWYIYTPLMVLATLGIYLLRRSWREAFWPIAAFFLLNVYVISSWTCWWYADSFGSRAMVGSYAVMALPLAAALHWAASGSRLRKGSMAAVLSCCTILNLFQYWQFRHGIIDKSRMTWAAYKAGFGRTTIPADMENLLLVGRSYSGEQGRPDSTRYQRVPMPELSARLPAPDTLIHDPITGTTCRAYRLDGLHPFTAAMRVPFDSLTRHDHAWVETEWRVLLPMPNVKGSFVSTFEHDGRNYGYTTVELEKQAIQAGAWATVHTWYLTPEVRSKNDIFACYFWLRDTIPLFVSGPVITTWQPKEQH
jgi:hypothetical protein